MRQKRCSDDLRDLLQQTILFMPERWHNTWATNLRERGHGRYRQRSDDIIASEPFRKGKPSHALEALRNADNFSNSLLSSIKKQKLQLPALQSLARARSTRMMCFRRHCFICANRVVTSASMTHDIFISIIKRGYKSYFQSSRVRYRNELFVHEKGPQHLRVKIFCSRGR